MNIYITDKTGAKFWNTDVSVGYANGERKNLARHLSGIKSGHPSYAFVDAASARIVEEVNRSDDQVADAEISDDDLLAALGV